MLVMYLCVRGTDVGHAFVCKGYRCWSCICLLAVSMLVMYLGTRGVDVGHVFVLEVSILVMHLFVMLSMLVIYLCVLDIDVGHVFVR